MVLTRFQLMAVLALSGCLLAAGVATLSHRLAAQPAPVEKPDAPKADKPAKKADPAKAQRLLNGSGEGDTAVGGVAQRLLAVAKSATDTTTGSLVSLANGKDTQATDLQKRIDDWDLRLELRQQTLTRQFTAMESALGTLQNQSSWLSSQLGSLPTWGS